MKKAIMFLLCSTLALMLTSCVFDDKHISAKKAEEVAEALTGEDVTYVDTTEDSEADRKYYTFEDTRGNKFDIISNLYKPHLDGFEYGSKYCEVDDTYAGSLIKSNKGKIIQVFKKYDILQYLEFLDSFDRLYCDTVVLHFSFEDIPEYSDELLKRFVKAGVEVDKILSYNYDYTYEKTETDNSFTFHTYGDDDSIDAGMLIRFKDDTPQLTFNFSANEKERWTENTLYKHFKSQL